MADFSTGRVNSATGQLVYAADNDTLGITLPVGTTSTTPTIQALGVIEGFNLGDGIGVFTTFDLNGRSISGFKSLLGGTGVTFVTDDQTITINSSATNVLAALTFETLGNGPSVFKQKIDGDVQMRSIVGGGIVAVQQGDDALTVSATAVTSIGLNGTSDILVANSPVTSAGTIDLSLADTGVSPGTYTNAALTIDSKGRVTAATAVSATPVTVQAGPGLLVSPGPNFTVSLPSLSVAPGIYTAPSLIIDTYGRITSAASNTIPGPISGLNLGAGAQVLANVTAQQSSYRSIVGAGAISVVQDDNTITISAPTSGTVTSISGTGTNGILVTGGPINTAGTLLIGLADTAVSPGTYTAATLTVDQTGRITSASSNTIVPGEANTASNIAGGYGLFAQKTGSDLQFKSIVAGSGVSITATAANVVISAATQGTPWRFVSSQTTAEDFQRYAANTMGGSFAIALPANPVDGSMVTVRDLVGSFASNPLTIGSASPMLIAGGSAVLVSSTSATCSVSDSIVSFIYSAQLDRWYIVN